MMLYKKFVLAVSALAITAGVFAAGQKDSPDAAGTKESANGGEVRQVRIAHTQAYPPYDFVNENGQSDGFEVAVMKAVDRLIPEYSFTFVPTGDDDLLIGVETGKYAGGIKGAWATGERRKKFIIPQNYIAASVVGIAFRAENAPRIKSLEDFAKFSGKLVPIPPQSAQYSVIEEFNAAHPATPIKLVPSDVFIITDAYTWVVEGRYDAFFDLKVSFQATVENPAGAWHRYAGKLSYLPYRAIPAYPLFNRNNAGLAAKYDAAIEKLKADGTLKKLSIQYFGEDIFQYI